MSVECFFILKKGDVVYDYDKTILGKCCYKTISNGKKMVCLENGPYIIWIHGKCMIKKHNKNSQKFIFTEGDKIVYYKDL